MKRCSYCGKESEDSQAVCGECGTPLAEKPHQIQPPPVISASEVRRRKRTLLRGLFEAAFAVVIFMAPSWLIERDAVIPHDTDNRLGPAVLFSTVAGFVFAVLAVRSFWRACSRELPPAAK
jgi:hypothetical protein